MADSAQWISQSDYSICISILVHKLLFLGLRSLIKKITQTAVINIIFQRIFIKLDVSYASQHTFSKVTVTSFENYIYIYIVNIRDLEPRELVVHFCFIIQWFFTKGFGPELRREVYLVAMFYDTECVALARTERNRKVTIFFSCNSKCIVCYIKRFTGKSISAVVDLSFYVNIT